MRRVSPGPTVGHYRGSTPTFESASLIAYGNLNAASSSFESAASAFLLGIELSLASDPWSEA